MILFKLAAYDFPHTVALGGRSYSVYCAEALFTTRLRLATRMPSPRIV